MQTLPLLRILACTLPLLPATPAWADPGANDVFIAPGGTLQRAALTIPWPCNGPVTLTLTLTPLDGGPSATRTVDVVQERNPDPCTFGCTNCAISYVSTLRDESGDVLLAGEGTEGGSSPRWRVAGAFQEGYLVASYETSPW